MRNPQAHLVSDNKFTVDAIIQLFAISKSNCTDLRSAVNDLYYSFKKQSIESIKNTNDKQADCKRCLVAIAGIMFQLRVVSGRECQLIQKQSPDLDVSVEEPSVFLFTQDMNEHIAETVLSLKNTCHKENVLSTQADELDKLQRNFRDKINSLLG